MTINLPEIDELFAEVRQLRQRVTDLEDQNPFTIQKAAHTLGIPENTLRHLCQRGAVPAYTMGKRYYLDSKAMDAARTYATRKGKLPKE